MIAEKKSIESFFIKILKKDSTIELQLVVAKKQSFSFSTDKTRKSNQK